MSPCGNNDFLDVSVGALYPAGRFLQNVACMGHEQWNGQPGCDFEKVTPRGGQKESVVDDGMRQRSQVAAQRDNVDDKEEIVIGSVGACV